MVNFPVNVKLHCKTCNNLFRTTVFNEIHIQPESIHISEVTVKLEELKKEISKEVKDTDGNIIGILSLKGFEFIIKCGKCSTTNNYSVADMIY